MSQPYKLGETTAGRKKFWFVCVDDTDGVTPETSLSFSDGELILHRAGTSPANLAGYASVVQRGSSGLHEGEFSTGELNVEGNIGIEVAKSGIRGTVQWIGYVTAKDPYPAVPDVNVASVTGNAITAASIANGAIDRATFAQDALDLFGALRRETAQGAGGTSSEIQLDAGASAVDDFFNEALLVLVGGTGAGQFRRVIDYIGASKIAVVDRAFSTNPDNTTMFEMFAGSTVSAAFDALLATVMEAGAGANAQTFLQQWRIMFSAMVGTAPSDLNASPYYFRNNPGGSDTKDRGAFTMVAGVRTPTNLDGT